MVEVDDGKGGSSHSIFTWTLFSINAILLGEEVKPISKQITIKTHESE